MSIVITPAQYRQISHLLTSRQIKRVRYVE
ncbi:hypothetical protein VPH209E381_0026 [Vibrio phage 209E38-1]